MREDVIFELIEQEKQRQTNGIELIASENFVSDHVMRAMGSVLTNKYAEGLPNKRYYGGCQIVDQVEQLAIDRLCQLFGATWANVQPHSGAQANAAVFLACLNPEDKILGLNLAHGGHLTHGSPVNFSGKVYQPIFYGVDQQSGLIDYNELEKIALKERPKMIVCGASAYSRDWDYRQMHRIADKIEALLLADIAHPAGLIATKLLNDPLEYCHIVTSTTHKTLRGPRGGVIMLRHNFDNPFGIKWNNGKLKSMTALLDAAVFPGIQGGPLEHVIAAKAVAFGEALSDKYKDYCLQVQKNASTFADELMNRGYKIVSNGTDNHLLLIDLQTKGLTGKEAEETLGKADITTNKNMIPFDPQSPFVTSGIRLGTPAITSRGIKETEIKIIVDWIDKVLTNKNNETIIAQTKKEINDFMSSRPLFC